MATTTFEIEKRLGNNGWIPPEKQQLLRSRNDSEMAGGYHPKCGPNAMPCCVNADDFFTTSGVELACYPYPISICGFDRGTLSAACWRAPTFQCAAFGPWVLMWWREIRACSFAAAALLQAPFDGWVVWFCTPDLCARTYVGISYGRLGHASCSLQLVHRHFCDV